MSESATVGLPPAVAGQRHTLTHAGHVLSYYRSGPAEAPPMLLIHSINAAASAYEVKPLYEHYREQRAVYAPDLPGFGHSDRIDREYTPRLMTDAIHAMVEEIRRDHGPVQIDALAVSLASEFLARAAHENPGAFRSLALVSPTGFNGSSPRNGPPGSHRGMPWLYKTFTFPLWSKGFFNLLTSRRSIRFFLRKTFGSKQIDEGLFDYDCLTTKQPGARHAPYYFVSGFLFSADVSRIYEALEMPVWFSHGVRGDFTDYRLKRIVEHKPNWRFDVFQTGALPHFEQTQAFVQRYDAFLAILDDSA